MRGSKKKRSEVEITLLRSNILKEVVPVVKIL